jgi:hypothetical protein
MYAKPHYNNKHVRSHNIISSFAAFLPVACRLPGQNYNDNHIQTILDANAFKFEYVPNSGMVEYIIKDPMPWTLRTDTPTRIVHGASILNVSTKAKHS